MIKKILIVSVFITSLISCEKDCDYPLDENPNGEKSSISLEKPIIYENSVELNWTVSNDSITSFNVVRVNGVIDDSYYSSSNTIATNLDNETLSFIDEEVPYTPVISYQIQGLIPNADNPYYSKIIYSNIIEYKRDISLIEFETDDIIYYQKKDQILFINRNDGLVKAYNFKTKEETDFDFNSGVGFCSLYFGNQKDELLVPREDGWLYIYNAENFELIEQIKISAFSIISSVIKDNIIFNCTSTSDEPMVVINRNTKEVISKLTRYGDESRRLEIIPNTNTELFSVNSDEISYYNYDSNGNLVSRKFKDPWDSEYAISSQYKIIPNSKKFICAPLGNIFNNTISYVNGLPRGDLKFSDFIINDDGSKVLAACSNNKSIEVYNLNNLSHIETISTKGYPYRIFYNNGILIIISKSSASNNYYSTTNGFIIEEINFSFE
ncbi:hypothetical protein [Zunongwangia sp.]|uniref:hypothetical protein n=1 Tax=Zunongwangia sp. TaxID=1965325 RepID=UPI003AA98DDD